MKKIVLILFMLTVLSGITFAGVFSFGGKNEKAPSLETVTVKRKNIGSSILATGSVKPVIGAEVKVGSRISGKVEHLYANIGNRVEKEQVIAEIEKNDLEAQVAQSKASAAVSEAKLLALENQQPKAVEIARSNIEGAKSLSYPGVSGEVSSSYGGITDTPQSNAMAGVKLSIPLYSNANNVNIKRAKTDLELTEMTYEDNLKIARAELDHAKAALEYSRVQLSYATIRAPISGVIASVTTQEGETIAAGLNAPTFVTIIDLSKLQIDAFVDETDIGRVKIGQKAAFTVDTYPEKEFTGKVKAIYPKAIIQENVVNFDVVIEIDGADIELLRPDMTTSVTIFQKERKGILVIPRSAVIKEENGKYVLVRQSSGAFKKIAVKTGIQSGNEVEIISGLNEGNVIGIKRD
jgi:multidrug efflux pump subunit AcrA (membrane-fusion protein)